MNTASGCRDCPGKFNVAGRDLDHILSVTILAGLRRRTQIAPTNFDLCHVSQSSSHSLVGRRLLGRSLIMLTMNCCDYTKHADFQVLSQPNGFTHQIGNLIVRARVLQTYLGRPFSGVLNVAPANQHQNN